jgi:cell wall-associated NlpC family hydrolase
MFLNIRMVVACLSVAVLAGCAQDGSGTGKRAGLDWRNASDPIGAFAIGPKYVAGLGEIDHPLANQALNQLGIRYKWGGKSPETGFDCSGLIVYSAQRSLGLKLPPRADDIAKFGDTVSKKDLQVGDLVFFNTLGTRYSHVGVYLGQDKFVHSPTRGSVVRIEDMTQRYWKVRYTGARRLDPTLLASR